MSLDPTVATLVDRAAADPDSDEDALIASLEADTAVDAFRERRLQQLHEEFNRAKELRGAAHGTYSEIKEEKALMDITTSTKYCVVHFFKPDFGRCQVMDGHLETLAPTHYETRIVRINVDNCPFLATKLKIQVLPCVIGFIDGVGVDRVIGFEGLGRTPDTFTTRDLEARLIRAGVLMRPKVEGKGKGGAIRRGKVVQEDSGDDWD